MKFFRLCFALFAFLGIPNHAFCQDEYQPGVLWLTVSDSSAKSNNQNRTNNSGLNQVFDNFNVTSYQQAMSFAKNPVLRSVYELNCNCNEDSLMNYLNANFGNLFLYTEKLHTTKLLYNPEDYMWVAHSADWLWHIPKIQGELAWDITRGDPNLKIAVIDNGVDITHPDLSTKIDPQVDFYNGSVLPNQGHGSSVVSLLAAETIETGNPSNNGELASIGFNCKVMVSAYMSSATCLYASNILGARIISLSWYDPSQCNNPSATDLLIEKEILDNGTTIVRAAGNGTGCCCSGGRLYPFSGLEDDRTIVVTSTDQDDYHQLQNTGCAQPSGSLPLGFTNSHYPEVDICAPGYCLMAAKRVIDSPTWPYYGSWGGTSQTTPVLAGVVALMLSVNPCLGPADVQSILKQTADPITDAANFPGQVGAGRVNAYKAVLGAFCPFALSTIVSGQNIGFSEGTNLNISGTLTDYFYSAQNDITSDATVNSGIVVAYKAENKIDLTPGFEAKAGSKFHAFINPYPCSLPMRLNNQANNGQSNNEENKIPVASHLLQNIPNPAKTITDIVYSVQKDAVVNISLYNIYGQKITVMVNDLKQEIGIYKITFDVSNLDSGIYFYTLTTGASKETKKMIIIK